MKIHEIIKDRRLARNLTQEQVANYLGVSTPAVNKWEKGNSYPDLTILPALARLLGTDLNTLLSFQEDLSKNEIGNLINKISEIYDVQGFAQCFEYAMLQIEEYPNCHELLLGIAMMLDGMITMHKSVTKDKETYAKAIEALYERVLNSDQVALRNQAQSMLIAKYMQRKEYPKAEAMIETLPDKNPVDKKQIQANLYIAYDKLDDAALLLEEKLILSANTQQGNLLSLMEIALKQGRIDDAFALANASKKSAEALDLWEYTSHIAHFQLYLSTKNRLKCANSFIAMLKAMRKKWNINSSPLYRHIKTKEQNENPFGRMQKMLLDSIKDDEEASFLNDNEEIKALKEQFDKEI